jgi:hypothetical protein
VGKETIGRILGCFWHDIQVYRLQLNKMAFLKGFRDFLDFLDSGIQGFRDFLGFTGCVQLSMTAFLKGFR